MTNEELRERLYAAYAHRGMLYYHIFDELRQEIGAERAKAIMKRAIYARGTVTGQKYARFAPADLEGVRDAFVGNSADDGRMFKPEVERCDAEGLDIKHGDCPLKNAWIEAGLSGDDVATLCEIAAAIDYGTFEGAGFRFACDHWKPGGDGCCHLHIRPGTD
jgi:hypothetical protein